MPSRNQKRTNILTILGVIVLLLLIVALINSYFVHERIKEHKLKADADAATSAAALKTNDLLAKQKADLAARQAAAAMKAAQVTSAANAQTQSFQSAVEETQEYSVRLNDIMTRWFAEYSDAKNDAMDYRAAHVTNLLGIYNELMSYKVPDALKTTKTQLLAEMATALDRLNVDPTTNQNYVHFEHDDPDYRPLVATAGAARAATGDDAGAAPVSKPKAPAPAFKTGATPDAPSWFNSMGDIGAGYF
jgi:hypothetical protein